MRHSLPVVVAALAFVGLIDSVLLTFLQFGTAEQPSNLIASTCPITAEACEEAVRSAHSTFLGIPTALLGVAYFAGVAAMAGRRIAARRWEVPWLTIGLLLVGIIFSTYLTTVLLTQPLPACPYCLAAHAINVAVFAVCLLSFHMDGLWPRPAAAFRERIAPRLHFRLHRRTGQ